MGLEGSTQEAMDKKVEELQRKLEEQRRRAREEVDGLQGRIAELQSKLEEDRHEFGKASATYNSRHVPAYPIREHS